MTREKERLEAAKNRFSDDQIYPITKMYVFIEGAKWADETMIDKACEWLENINTDDYMDSGIFQIYDLIGNLRKAMEEK